jgi:hypothetical protein
VEACAQPCQGADDSSGTVWRRVAERAAVVAWARPGYSCREVRRLLIACAVVVLGGIGAGALALGPAHVRGERVRVAPPAGSPDTVFVLRFKLLHATGVQGRRRLTDVITASAPAGAGGCVGSVSVRARDGRAGTHAHVVLDPRQAGGRWCQATYHGRVAELATAVCPRGEPCPAYVLVRAVVGSFSFKVRAAPGAGAPRPTGTTPAGTPPPTGTTTTPSGAADTTPPGFAGLQSAFACTPGPQRPGQTTPFTLTWQSATDDVTPSSEIVFDVYLSSTPGGERFATPTWTTPPGVTSYRTPGLASHDTFYFVVRARDQAGNQDHNTVERRGVDPCY